METRNFSSALFLLSLAFALMGGCGTGGAPDPHDVTSQDQTSDDQNGPDQPHPDTIGQDTTKQDVGTVCDQNGICCTGTTCCQNGNCWIVTPDVIEDTADGAEVDAEPECYTNEWCTTGQICTLDTQKCLPDTVLEPYLFLEGDWKCLEGCKPLYKLFPLTLNGYEEDTETMKAQGLIGPSTLKFHYEANGLSLLSATTISGVELTIPTFDTDEQTISFEHYEEGWGTTHWLFKLQPK